MGPAAALHSCSGPRTTCLSGSRGPSPTVLRVLSLGSPMGPSTGFSSRQWRRQLTGQPWDGPWETVWLVVPGAPTCVHVCAQRPHLCKRCSARGQRHGSRSPCLCRAQDAGLEGKARSWAVECLSSKYLLNTSSWWAVTFPSRPRLPEQKSLGHPHSPASGQS